MCIVKGPFVVYCMILSVGIRWLMINEYLGYICGIYLAFILLRSKCVATSCENLATRSQASNKLNFLLFCWSEK